MRHIRFHIPLLQVQVRKLMTQRWVSVGAVSAVLGLLALLAWGMARPGSGSGSGRPGVNSEGSIARIEPRPAPNIRLSLFDGRNTPWQLGDQRGKRVVINFWASWCVPCRTEAGILARAAREYNSRGISLVGVNVWDDQAAARGFLDEFKVEYPNGIDAGGTAAVDYGVTGIPETVVVDEQGRMTARWIGPVTRAALESMVAP